MLTGTIRVLTFGFGFLVFLSGLVALGVAGAVWDAAWAVIVGSVFMIAALLQRPRYRSADAERSNSPAGPGGGESGTIAPRFVPTTEVFIDPTSRRRMRVFIDPRSGERLYRAED